MPTISDFKSAISAGLTRQNRWQVTINIPSFAGATGVTSQAKILARSAETPTSTIGAIEVPFSGRVIPVPGDRVYAEFPITFISTNDHTIRDALESWSEGINGSESNNGLTSFDDYMRDIQLDLLDAADNVTKTYILQDAWPLVVGGMQLDQSAQDSYAEFNCVWRYTNYVSNTTR